MERSFWMSDALMTQNLLNLFFRNPDLRLAKNDLSTMLDFHAEI